jgi:hypothetical protein
VPNWASFVKMVPSGRNSTMEPSARFQVPMISSSAAEAEEVSKTRLRSRRRRWKAVFMRVREGG